MFFFSIYQWHVCLYHIFLCFNDKYLSHDLFVFFIFISDKYVSHFFMYLRKILPLYLFLHLLVTNTWLVYFFYVSMINIYLVFILFINENRMSRDFCTNDEFLCFASFQKYFFKEKCFFHILFMYHEQILVLSFSCINDKYLSRVSLFVNDNYLSRDFCFIDEYMWCAYFNLFS